MHSDEPVTTRDGTRKWWQIQEAMIDLLTIAERCGVCDIALPANWRGWRGAPGPICDFCYNLAVKEAADMKQEPTPPTTPWPDRIDAYVKATGFPRSLFVAEDGRVVGTWIMGNDYRVKSEYYGGYPAGYLRRIRSMFPDKQRVLHLFSGKVDLAALPGDTVDINADLAPTFVDDAQRLENVPLADYDLVLADPPYSVEDAERYQTTMVKRNAVMAALRRLSPGAHVVWLDQVLPMYRKDAFAIDAVIGMVKSTNHRFRMVTIFRRIANG